ncbi:MAG: NAD(P)H-hydrate dehydratase [Pseudomonadota bacterium]
MPFPSAIDLDDAALRAWPLPLPAADGDKEQRGHVLVLGGSHEMPGAVILAAGAALRAGAGKLTIATGASVAHLVALAIPEARVIALPENPNGGFTAEAAALIDPLADAIDALLVGPGMKDEPATAALVRALLPRLAGCAVVLDACAMGVVRAPDAPGAEAFRFAEPVIMTPHAGEMAHLTGISKHDILITPEQHAAQAAQRWNAVLALKGARTLIGTPEGELFRHEGGNIGLAISGSGDTLAGIIAGLAARGAGLAQATCWGVALHARAGEKLATRFGVLGYLAREIADEVPGLMAAAPAAPLP